MLQSPPRSGTRCAWSLRANPSRCSLMASNISDWTMITLPAMARWVSGQKPIASPRLMISCMETNERAKLFSSMKEALVSKWLAFALAAVAIVAFASWRLVSGPQPPTVVVYVGRAQVFSEAILKDFEKETGVSVRAIYDPEETKSTGAMNRLIAEKNNPQADVYWANEPIRAEVLRQQGIAAPYISANSEGIPAAFKDANGYWTGFAARARVLLGNKNASAKPDSILAYADPQWRGKSVIANPLFGTTTTQIAALFVLWGDGRAQAFMSAMKANGTKLAPSNGDSADQVAR